MFGVLAQVLVSFAFLVFNVLLLLLILRLNPKSDTKLGQVDTSEKKRDYGHGLDPSAILTQEFEYARATASEAMQDRHKMVNFYLIIAGVAVSGVLATLSRDTHLSQSAGAILLWALCGIGWLYFLKLVRLRQAWHDSARAMNQIKEFCIEHNSSFDPQVLRTAFRWQARTLPAPHKPWTLFFYSAALIGFLNSAAFVSGGVLLNLEAVQSFPLPALGALMALGLLFFIWHIWLYFAFLEPEKEGKVT